MTTFNGVPKTLDLALQNRGYNELTPVQQDVLAPELIDQDMLVSAQTGSGKTVAFGLAIAPTVMDDGERFTKAKTPLALIVAPTRELALQVQRELEWLYKDAGAQVVACVGGMDARDERRRLERGAHIVVGTPGRLCDHINRKAFNTSTLRAIVLDEADEMLDLGFQEELEYILNAAPENRRTLMFSATVPRSISSLAKRYQNNAVRLVASENQKQHLDIDYRALTIAPKDQENAIINVLRYYDAQNAIVFCATRSMVNHMTARFNNRGFSVVALSGELSQNERTHALQSMRDGRAKVCIATDVAARGIDLPKLELVIHADLPKNPESLLHRSGRTGRAGRKGVSVLIVPFKARKRTERLLQNASIKATWDKPPSAEDILKRDDERILSDETLTKPLNKKESSFAAELLQRFEPEQIAGAFVRLHRSGQSAPEDLLDVPATELKSKQGYDFSDGQWISLSIGRGDRVEPGRMLAMLCRVGDLSKKDIGAIRIQDKETFVEIDRRSIDKFMTMIGPDQIIEKTITITKLDKAPKLQDRGSEKRSFEKRAYEKRSSEKSSYGKKPYEKKSSDERSYDKKRKFSKSEKIDGDRKAAPVRKYKEKAASGDDWDHGDKDWSPKVKEGALNAGSKRDTKKTKPRAQQSDDYGKSDRSKGKPKTSFQGGNKFKSKKFKTPEKLNDDDFFKENDRFKSDKPSGKPSGKPSFRRDKPGSAKNKKPYSSRSADSIKSKQHGKTLDNTDPGGAAPLKRKRPKSPK